MWQRLPDWPVAIPLWIGIPPALWVVITLFRDDVRRAFIEAAEQRAEKTGTDPVSLPWSTPPNHPEPPDRPPLVLLLATIDLFAAVALLLILYNTAPYSESMSRLWHRRSQVEIVMGFIGGAGLFVTSVSLLLWKPWARKLILGVCFFFMAQWVIAMPDLTQIAFPMAWDEVRQQALSQGDPAEDAKRKASLAVAVGFGVLFVVGLTWLIGHLVYFTRPRVVAAFESQRE